MSHLDKSLYPDIHGIDCIDTVIGLIPASCGCQSKSPTAGSHDPSCRYRHVASRIEELDKALSTSEF